MDAIFWHQNFRTEIIWKRTSAHSDALDIGSVHDTILRYTKGDSFKSNKQFQPLAESYVTSHYRHRDKKGRVYRTDNVTAGGLSGGGYKYEWNGVTKVWRYPQERMQELHEADRLHYTRTGSPEYIRYLAESKGTPLQSVWTDIAPINSQAKERMGYPTQKPNALLERIIKASSNEGDVVLDPFAGCGTTVVAARKLNRRFLGIDISHFAIDLVRDRRLKDARVPVHGVPVDLQTAERMARDEALEFEKWAVTRVPGMVPNDRQVGDGGIDGRGTLLDGGLVLAQVKGGSFQLGQLRDFRHVMARENAACGVFTTLRPVRSRNARTEAHSAGFLELGATRYPKTQLWSIADYFDHRPPVLPALADPYTGKAMQGDLFV